MLPCQWICLFRGLRVWQCLVKQFAICLGVFVILLLNVMELLCVVGGALLDRPCMVFHRMCVLCLWSQWASRCSFHMFCLCFVYRKLSPHIKVWELDHRCLLFLCYFFVWFYILWLRVRSCNCYASFPLVYCPCLPSVWCLWKFCWQCACILVGMVFWAKADSVSSVNCVQSGFLQLVNVRRFCCSL